MNELNQLIASQHDELPSCAWQSIDQLPRESWEPLVTGAEEYWTSQEDREDELVWTQMASAYDAYTQQVEEEQGETDDLLALFM
ncbi:hypothetical protein HNR62_000307 [Oceanisphaera litoralis]|uniref:hypothetical protein n=1 Tax=Oceanisphaera litoralis TaxID=225144 RepID=UPI00195AF83A|nr:hypothetical protein [Oceanisphaera litoralis]MBM7454478.1 hypothetical protein [Oceanisphaera litoralis]